MIKSVVWSSMLDFPGRVSTVLFTGACNWRCDFCHNFNLFTLPDMDFESSILPKLLERIHMVNTVVISGGEPSVFGEECLSVIKCLYSNGFTIGIHTNGSNPSFIDDVQPYVTFYGMDIKTSSDRYKELVLKDITKIDHIADSIDKIVQNGKLYEFRTTLYPKFVSKNDAVDISNMLAGFKAKKYVLQAYRTDDVNEDIYTEVEMQDIRHACSRNIWTELRGV